MNNSVLNIINQAALKTFSSITFIDILNDSVIVFDASNMQNVEQKNTYEGYYEKLKKILHPDYLNTYFEKISLNYLQNSKNDFECINYSKLSSNLSYDNYLDIIQKVNDNQILILSIKCDLGKCETNNDSELSYLTADLIVDIESVIDNLHPSTYEVSNALKYISELLNNLKIKNDEVLKKYQEKITLEVNKINESLLLVDDDALTRNIFKKIFEKDFNIIEAKNGAEAVEIIENNIVNRVPNPENIVGMFLDLKMPVMDGFGVLNYLKEKRIISRIPVVIISADDAKETKEAVYKYDIADMIEKPFNYELIKKRVGNMVRMYAKSNVLNDLIRIQDRELKDILNAYTKSYLVDYKKINDLVKKFGKILLDKYAVINNETVDTDTILRAAELYDLSLDFVPRSYINNVNNLNAEEKQVVLNYPTLGANIIKYVTENENDSFIKYATTIVKLHNERYDGLGFPSGIKEDAIPYYVYLINIALEYTNYVLTHSAMDYEEIKKIINDKVNKKYHPKAIETFNAAFEEMK